MIFTTFNLASTVVVNATDNQMLIPVEVGDQCSLGRSLDCSLLEKYSLHSLHLTDEGRFSATGDLQLFPNIAELNNSEYIR